MWSVEPGEYNWTQLTTEFDDQYVDRMLRSPLFFLGSVAPGDVDDAPDSQEALLELVPESERAAVEEIVERDAHARLRKAAGGRGADISGIALQVAEVIGLYGGVAMTLIESARGVRWGYRRLARARGVRPMVSLGAAEHLSAADLVDKVGEEAQLALVGSGDMQSQNHDRSFTGGDAFFVVLSDGRQLHHYHVSAFGETFYIGVSPLIPPWTEATAPEWTDPESTSG